MWRGCLSIYGKENYNLILKFSYSMLQIGRSYPSIIISMKKILFTAFIVGLALATTCSSCCSGPTCQPTIDVNNPICVEQPGVITPPACVIPQIPQPCVCPPTTQPPIIKPPVIDVPDRNVPQVVCPPTIQPPTISIPPPNIPQPCPPVLPPVPPPACVLPPPPPPANCPPPPPTLPIPAPLSNKFDLSFQYACRQGTSLGSCLANVLWNDQIIVSIVPSNYNVQTFTVQVQAKAGENRLQIEGAGVSDSYGLTVDNVKLIRVGTTQNIVVNGGFEQPNVGHSWGIFNNVPGWSGIAVEVGWGSIYNSAWSSQVVELDGHANYQITQTFNFNSKFELVAGISCDTNSFQGKTLTYVLEFDYAARSKGVSSAFTSSADVIWNDVVVASINPQDYVVRHASISVQLKAGENVLSFDAASHSDSFGLQIDNVKLSSALNSSNLIVNGGFESPYVGGSGQWNYFNGGIYGWTAVKAEVGHCNSVYNGNWNVANSQCIELDSDSNQRYTQKIIISQSLFTALLVQQAANAGNAAVSSNLASETCNALSATATAIAKIQGDILCQINLKAHAFNKYLCNLYQVADAQVQGLEDDEQLTLSQYDCLSDAYVHQFGSSNQVDFDDDAFDATDLEDWYGYIVEIRGKVIKCRDGHGNHHWLQIAPCTHFEGQFPAPKLGAKIFWKGAKQPCGITYVKWATTCNC